MTNVLESAMILLHPVGLPVPLTLDANMLPQNAGVSHGVALQIIVEVDQDISAFAVPLGDSPRPGLQIVIRDRNRHTSVSLVGPCNRTYTRSEVARGTQRRPAPLITTYAARRFSSRSYTAGSSHDGCRNSTATRIELRHAGQEVVQPGIVTALLGMQLYQHSARAAIQ